MRYFIVLLSMIAWPAMAAGESAISAGQVSGLLFSLLLVIGLIFVCAWLVKRVSNLQHANNKQLRVVASVNVGAKERAVLVQVGEEQILLGVAQGQVSNLKTLDTPIEIAAPQVPDFAAQLKKFRDSRGGES
jgi:flagellar protein FliO/FliZ